jgi:hypothetical protein
MEARNRKLTDWYGKIQRAEIKLPRFQRFEAWDRGESVAFLKWSSKTYLWGSL